MNQYQISAGVVLTIALSAIGGNIAAAPTDPQPTETSETSTVQAQQVVRDGWVVTYTAPVVLMPIDVEWSKPLADIMPRADCPQGPVDNMPVVDWPPAELPLADIMPRADWTPDAELPPVADETAEVPADEIQP